MPRLVRRKPTIQRLKDYLNPGDWWLYLAEEFETADWDKQYASPLALGLHIVLLIARANTGSSLGSGQDDVFGDDYSKTGWLSSIVSKQTLPHYEEFFPDNHTGHLYGIFVDCLFHRKCDIHILSETTLPLIRKLYRCPSEHPFRTSSARGFFSSLFFAITVPYGNTRGYQRRVKSAPRSNPRCMGTRCLGPNTDLSPSVLLFQPRPCPGILALPSNHGSRPSAQRHGLHDTPFTSAVIFAAISPFFVLLPAGEGFRHYSQGGYERVRYQICTPSIESSYS